MLNLPAPYVIQLVNDGIDLQKSDFLQSKTPFQAEDYLAAGYAKQLVERGVALAKPDQDAISDFITRAINRNGNKRPLMLNKLTFEFKDVSDGNVEIAVAGGQRVALLQGIGMNARMTVSLTSDFDLWGETLIQHAWIGPEQHNAFLITRYHPPKVIMAAIALVAYGL